MTRRTNPWLQLSLDAWTLSAEASTVIGLRCLKMAAGGASAEAEAQLMVREKVASVMALQAMAMTGRLGATPEAAASRTMTHYLRKVSANRRRLQRM